MATLCTHCATAPATVQCAHSGVYLPFCSESCSEQLCEVLRVGPRFGENVTVDELADMLDAFTITRKFDWRRPIGWASAPVEIKLMILGKLPLIDLVRLPRVDLEVKSLLQDDLFWKAESARYVPLLRIPRTQYMIAELYGWKWVLLNYFAQQDFIVKSKDGQNVERVIALRQSLGRYSKDGRVLWFERTPQDDLVLHNADILRSANPKTFETIQSARNSVLSAEGLYWRARGPISYDPRANTITFASQPNRGDPVPQTLVIGLDSTATQRDLAAAATNEPLPFIYKGRNAPLVHLLPNPRYQQVQLYFIWEYDSIRLRVLRGDAPDLGLNKMTVPTCSSLGFTSSSRGFGGYSFAPEPGVVIRCQADDTHELTRFPTMPRPEWAYNWGPEALLSSDNFEARVPDASKAEARELDSFFKVNLVNRMGVSIRPTLNIDDQPAVADRRLASATAIIRPDMSRPFLAPPSPQRPGEIIVVYFADVRTTSWEFNFALPTKADNTINDEKLPDAFDFHAQSNGGVRVIRGVALPPVAAVLEVTANTLSQYAFEELKGLALRTRPADFTPNDALYVYIAFIHQIDGRLGRAVKILNAPVVKGGVLFPMRYEFLPLTDNVDIPSAIPTNAGGPDGIAKRMGGHKC